MGLRDGVYGLSTCRLSVHLQPNLPPISVKVTFTFALTLTLSLGRGDSKELGFAVEEQAVEVECCGQAVGSDYRGHDYRA